MTASIRKSGANLHVGMIGESYDGSFCGQVLTPATPAQVPLTAAENACFQVVVQASNANAVGTIVYVGNAEQGCVIELTPGQSFSIPINDTNKVYVRGSVASLIVNFFAVI